MATGQILIAVRLTHHRPRVGSGREPSSPDPKSCHACWMVMPTLIRNSVNGAHITTRRERVGRNSEAYSADLSWRPAQYAALLRCAPKACVASGGRFHLDSSRLD